MSRTSQGILYVIIRRYKKWAPLILPTLLVALTDSDIDTVKGALHTLRFPLIEHTLARNPEYTEDYVLGLIHAFESFDRVIPKPVNVTNDQAIRAKWSTECDNLLGAVQQANSLEKYGR